MSTNSLLSYGVPIGSQKRGNLGFGGNGPLAGPNAGITTMGMGGQNAGQFTYNSVSTPTPVGGSYNTPSNVSNNSGGFGFDSQVNPQQASMQGFGMPDNRPPPKTPDGGGIFGPEGLSKISTISDVISGFGQIYAGIQANKIAKESLAFQKESYAENLGNQIQSYNTSLEDRARARYAQSNGTTAQADAYIDKNRLGD